MNIEEKKLLEKAKKIIPLHKLRKEVPTIKSKSKEPFIIYLLENKREFLEWLVQYHLFLKTHSVFFLYSKKRLNFGKLKNRYKIPIDEENNIIYDLERSKIFDNHQLVSLKVHSEKRELRNIEDPETLKPMKIQYRKPFNITFLYHTDTSILECRTKKYEKLISLQEFICNIFNIDESELVRIKLSQDELKKEIREDIRPKFVILKDIRIAGASEMIIKGENVRETLDYFKNKGIDLEEEAGEVIFKKVSSQRNPITLHENGKITFTRKIGDVYSLLKPLLVKKCQE